MEEMERSNVLAARTRRSEERLADACRKPVTPGAPERRLEAADPYDVWDVIERLDEGGWDESPQEVCARWESGEG